MSKEIFFGLVRKERIDPLANMYGLGVPELELYLVNDSDSPITVKKKTFGGFQTFDDVCAMFTPQDEETDIIIEPHDYILYDELYEYSEGAGQYQAIVETEGNLKMLDLYSSRLEAGFMGSLIPCVNKRGRVVHPIIRGI
jgi:hypothetical protein